MERNYTVSRHTYLTTRLVFRKMCYTMLPLISLAFKWDIKKSCRTNVVSNYQSKRTCLIEGPTVKFRTCWYQLSVSILLHKALDSPTIRNDFLYRPHSKSKTECMAVTDARSFDRTHPATQLEPTLMHAPPPDWFYKSSDPGKHAAAHREPVSPVFVEDTAGMPMSLAHVCSQTKGCTLYLYVISTSRQCYIFVLCIRRNVEVTNK